MMTSPIVYAKALYAAVAGCTEKDAKKIISAFGELMQERGLATLLPHILNALPKAAREHDGVRSIEVRSVVPLTKKDIEKMLEGMDIDEDKAEITHVVDESVVIGFVATAHDVRIDHSLGARLAALRSSLGN
jgi:F0F1-type ATP synthase delta subunit